MAINTNIRGKESAILTSRAILDIWGVRIDTGPATTRDLSLFSSLKPADPRYFSPSVDSVRMVLEDYPPEMIARSRLKVIKFADQLVLPADTNHKYDYEVAGCVSLGAGIIYLRTDPYPEDTLHHETAHLFEEALPPRIQSQFYDRLGEINDRYSIDYDPRNINLIYRPFGFVTPYAATDISEEIPEILSLLMTGPYELYTMAENDPAMTAKIDLTFDFLDVTSNNALSGNWRRFKESCQPFRFLQVYNGFNRLVDTQ